MNKTITRVLASINGNAKAEVFLEYLTKVMIITLHL